MNYSDRLRKAAKEMCAATGMGVRELRGTLIVPKCTQIVLADFAKLLKEMVGNEETRTPDLYRVKAATSRNLLNLNGADSPFWE
jgi:hypothetical protein